VLGALDPNGGPLDPDAAGLPPGAGRPSRHLAELGGVLLLLRGEERVSGAPVHVLAPADLAFVSSQLEFRFHPIPHFQHRSVWAPVTGRQAPRDLLVVEPVPALSVASIRRRRIRGGGFWDTLWRVVLTPFTAVADGAITVGTLALYLELKSYE